MFDPRILTEIAAGLSILTFLWRIGRGVRKVLAEVRQFNELAPVIREIANEFKTNHGSSLKDQMDKIESMARRAEGNSAEALAATKIQAVVLEGICAKLSSNAKKAKS